MIKDIHREQVGYNVIGVDCSPAMVRLANRRAPRATFMIGSRLTNTKTRWDAIVAIGEVFNYLPSHRALQNMMRRSFVALRSGGCLVFDVRILPPPGSSLKWSNGRTGKDWAVIATSSVALSKQRLTRTITTFRKARGHWRRGQEIHRQQLYHSAKIHSWLQAEGFLVRMRHGNGETKVSLSGRVFIARKPIGLKS
jgi:cyclopropane fatty-acyl-phospholipid synthase-like methyltransferase